MKIVFFGTSAIACFSLRTLIESNHEVLAVVTKPDRPAGRGRKILRCPVAFLADEFKLTVLQSFYMCDLVEKIATIKPDLLVVVAFGQILSKAMLEIALLGAINVHASLLPALRGAAPFQRAIMQGLTRTGVTTMYMDQGVDTGDVILQKQVEITSQDTAASLGVRLGKIGAILLKRTIKLISEGVAPRMPQDHTLASLAPPLRKEEGLVNWTLSAQKLAWLIRGVDPWPGAFTNLAGQKIKLFSPTVVLSKAGEEAAPGTIMANYKSLMLVATGQGLLGINEIQVEGKRRINVVDFLHGARLLSGVKLGE